MTDHQTQLHPTGQPDPSTKSPAGDPTVATGSARTWMWWLSSLLHHGQKRLAALGLTLVLGFAAGLLSLYLFYELTEDMLDRETQHLDDAVLALLRSHGSPALDALARLVSTLGSEWVAVLLVVMIVAFAWQRRWGAAVSLVLVVVGAQLLNNVLKELFQRTRPSPVMGIIPAQQFSFPSGHAMVSMAFYLFLAYVGWRTLRGWARAVWTSSLLFLVLAIGLSRMYLGVHYLTDVVAGYLAGFIWTDTVIVGGHMLSGWRNGRALARSRAVE